MIIWCLHFVPEKPQLSNNNKISPLFPFIWHLRSQESYVYMKHNKTPILITLINTTYESWYFTIYIPIIQGTSHSINNFLTLKLQSNGPEFESNNAIYQYMYSIHKRNEKKFFNNDSICVHENDKLLKN